VEQYWDSLLRELDQYGPEEQPPQPWLDACRTGYNQVRSHEALALKTPAGNPARGSIKDVMKLDTLAPCKPSWEYPHGSLTLKVGSHEMADIVASGLALLQQMELRYVVFCCVTQVYELDSAIRSSKSSNAASGT
jgi:hypothetical protein